MPNSAEILSRHFEKAGFGGYKAADVEAFINDIRTFIAAQNKEIADLKRKLDDANKKSAEYSNQTESLKNTLLNAQIVADKTVADAKAKAEEILTDAETKAASTLSSAKIKVENTLDCAESEVKMRQEEAETIKAETYDFKLKLMKLYRAQIELINEIPAQKPIPAEQQPEEEATEEPTEETTAETEEAPKEAEAPAQEAAAEEPTVVKPAPIEDADKEESQETKETKPEEEKTEEPVEPKADKAEEEAAATQVKTVKLNLRYNEATGEYEPLGALHDNSDEPGLFNFGSKKGKNGDGLKFGADYNIRTDSFDK